MSQTQTLAEGLSVAGLCAGYGQSRVIKNLSLNVRPGEIAALLGPNGAGKTTTLMSIAGFLPGTVGSVQVNGQPVEKASHRRMRTALGLVLEGRSVIPSLTVEQNLVLGEVDVEQALEIFPPLAKCRKTRAGMLSGGEQQMVSLVRAVCRNPAVLLIDELSLGLSPIICERLFAVLRSHASKHRMAVLLVEQHLQYAASVSDRALIMTGGTFAIELPASQLHERAAEIEELYVGTSLAE